MLIKQDALNADDFTGARMVETVWVRWTTTTRPVRLQVVG